MQEQHKRFSKLSMMQSLSEREWYVLVYNNMPATNLIDDQHMRPSDFHT